MFLLLSFLLSSRAGTCALPILFSRFSEASTEDHSFDVLTTASTGACTGRSLWDILWSCLATTFACTWVSVHPNIPFFGESKASTRRWRIYLMLVSLIAPEIMILWAFKQLQGAVVIMRTVNKSYKVVNTSYKVEANEKKDSGNEGTNNSGKLDNAIIPENPLRWTLTHAQYLQMGGYRLQCLRSQRDDIPSRYGRTAKATFAGGEREVWELPLSFETMQAAFNKGYIDMPFITRDEILDKNGRDGLSKAIAIIQLTWFIIQIAARIHQNLAVTELELTTGALASINIAMYISWWSKPTDIQCPTVIMTKDLQVKTWEWMRPIKRRRVNTWSPVTVTSPRLEIGDFIAMAHYRIRKVEDKEKINLAKHYWVEFTKAMQETWESMVNFPAKLGAGCIELARGLGEQIRGVWASPSQNDSDSEDKSTSNHNSSHGDPLSVHTSPSKAPQTSSPKPFIRKIKETISLIWRAITHLFLALIYYPILAILYSGQKLKAEPTIQDMGDVDNMTAFKLMFDEKTLRLAMDMVFFCEEVASAPFSCLAAFSGAVFGMIHCLAWNFEFPSHVEQVIWRTSSSIISGLCILIMALSLLYIIIKVVKEVRGMDPTRHRFFKPKFTEMVFSTFAVWFVLTRFSLLVLSIMGLRALPASAFDTVEWSGFIPHV